MNPPLSWIEVCLTVDPQLSESCSSIIFEETGQGSITEDPAVGISGVSRLRAYLPKDISFRHNLLKLRKRVFDLHTHFPEFPSPHWDLRQIFAENWQENWKKYFKPLRVCSNIIVCPTWETFEPQAGERVIRLDPGQAFGTGGHLSTRLCLKAMESLSRGPWAADSLFSRVLDVGTGSGILALAAACFQARRVLAIDNDPLAVEAAQAHVRLNQMEDIIRVELATPETVQGPFSLILANLTLNDLLSLAPTLKNHLAPKGILVTSGVLGSQAGLLIRTLAREKVPLETLILEEEWACVIFRAEK
ncbi:MAG: 50S ribosomal protein L11 methyltransferase [Thermodesulfobacteriota bacterium]